LTDEDDQLAYPFAISRLKDSGLPCLEPLPMWQALLDDLLLDTPTPLIATRFHKGLAIAITRMAEELDRPHATKTIALSGGVFQNRTLLEQVVMRLENAGFRVLTHHLVPANDGSLALGQAAVAAARALVN